jgi:hypothetical protein
MRTMQTALHVFDDVLKDEKVRLIAVPDLREWGRDHASTGTSYEDIKSSPALRRVDLEMVTHDWHVNRERLRDKSRATVVRNDLFEMAKQVQKGENSVWPTCGRVSALFEWSSYDTQSPFEIAVVSHANFMETVLDVPTGSCCILLPHFPSQRYVPMLMVCALTGNGFYNANLRSYEFCTTVDENGKESYTFLQTIDSINSKMGRGPVYANTNHATDMNLCVAADMPDVLTSHSTLKYRVTSARAGKVNELFAEVKRFLTKARAGEQSVEGLEAQMRRFESRVDKLYAEDEKKVRWVEQRYWNEMKEKNAKAKLYEYIGPGAIKFKRAVHPWLAEVADEGVKEAWQGNKDYHLIEGNGEDGSTSEEIENYGLGISVQHENEEWLDMSLQGLNGHKSGRVGEDKSLKRKASEDHKRMDVIEGCIVDDEIIGVMDIREEHGQQE